MAPSLLVNPDNVKASEAFAGPGARTTTQHPAIVKICKVPPEIPLDPPEAVKKNPGSGELEGLGMPGEGATKEAFASFHSIFSQLPFFKGGNPTTFICIYQERSPPFEKGRAGGISGKAFSNG
jgi:hypothetical protein